MVYESAGSDTLKGIADYYGVAVQDIARLNNIPEPWFEYTIIPSGDKLLVPDLYNGRETFENRDLTGVNFKSEYGSRFNEEDQRRIRSAFNHAVGYASQGACSISVSGVGFAYFPCYPESYSDSHQASLATQTPLGRSEPFYIYQNSGPRTVNVSFRMDREMTHTSDIGYIVRLVQSACYPAGTYATIIPRCTLTIGNNCSITGLISNVNTNWSDTIIGGQYMVATLDFSVQECTGHPRTASGVAG